MDKAIIDGVDVSGCEHANACDKKLKCVILQDDVCETKPYCEGYNCYYKQLQRAKTENERLKEEKQELSIEIVSLTSKLFTLEKSSNDLSQGVNKLYKALQEIRAIAERAFVVCDDDCGNANRFTDILDKINSVIGAEE